MQAQASEHGSAPIMQPQHRPRLGGKLSWIALGFVLGAGFWHAVGFWSFVTAVTLTGNAPDRGSLTSLVLTPPKSHDVVAPTPVVAERPQPIAPSAPAATHNETPSSTVATSAPAGGPPQSPTSTPESNAPAVPTTLTTPTSEPRLAAAPQPPDAPRTEEPEPVSPRPQTVSSTPRAQPETPAWAARIITGTLDR